jgi:single-strand selective monofunctional uracil DNA glycosylase
MRLAAISRKLAEDVGGLRFSAPIAHVYNPLVYARTPH